MGRVNVDRIKGESHNSGSESPTSHRGSPREVRLRFVVDKVALAQGFLRVLWFYFVIFPLTLLTLTDIAFK
jgi:hypothetical protein